MNLNSYKQYLLSGGYTLGQVSKSDSDANTDYTFCDDSLYKRVYILTKDGWKFEDAKYQFHTAKSILRDDVDYYLQFRPKIHYPIGSYVIVPDDTDFDVNLSKEELKNPFLQPIDQRTQWWIIVDRDNGYDDVQYNILKCNWNFKWLYKGKIQEVFGCTRSANSYTSWSALPIKHNTARCIWKHCSVFLRICWNTLRAITPKQKDEICLDGW